MADPARIKPDPEMGSPPVEDDDFEDAGDLEFYDPSILGDPMGTMYLARLPNYVWEAWSQLEDDDDEIQIGTIRQWSELDANGVPQPKLKLLLSNIEEHRKIPKEYTMNITDPHVDNTFVFSEQDLPGYAAKNKAKAEALAQGIPSHLLRQKTETKPDKQNQEKGKKGYTPQRQRAIPKKTAIAGRIRHELACLPMDNAETERILTLRAVEAMKPKAQTTIINSLPRGPNGIIHAGTQRAHEAFEGFIKSAPKVEKVKKMENKTARWEENILIDKISEAFTKYNYWSMKALRDHIPQPEAYLRETLDKVADLHRSGKFANHWSLKPEFKRLIEERDQKPLPGADSIAPPMGGDGANADDGEDDDDVKMEDAL